MDTIVNLDDFSHLQLATFFLIIPVNFNNQFPIIRWRDNDLDHMQNYNTPLIIHSKILPVSSKVKAESADPFFLKSSGEVHHRNAFLQMKDDDNNSTDNKNTFRNVISKSQFKNTIPTYLG